MEIYFAPVLSILLVKGVLAQNLYTLPENYKSSSISSFENLNGAKGAKVVIINESPDYIDK